MTDTTGIGDQIQAALDASGIDAIGFVVVVRDGPGVTIESRSRIDEAHFWNILARASRDHPSI